MNLFLKKRFPIKIFVFTLLLGILITLFHVYQVVVSKTVSANIWSESPYTSWIGIDGFDFSAIIFFFLIPFIASIPCSTLLRQDINNRFFIQLKIRKSIKNIIWSYASIALIFGFIVISIPLLINLTLLFAFLPNVKPDDLINLNLLIIHKNTLFVSLYYNHPLIHAILSILFASIWGGLFSLFTFTCSFFIKNKFVALCSGLVLQIVLFICEVCIKLPDSISYAPFNFIKETNGADVNIYITGMVTILLFLYCIVMIICGGKRSVIL